MDSGFGFVPLQLRVTEMNMRHQGSQASCRPCRYWMQIPQWQYCQTLAISSRLELHFNSWSRMHAENKEQDSKISGSCHLVLHSLHAPGHDQEFKWGTSGLRLLHSSVGAQQSTTLFTRWHDAKNLNIWILQDQDYFFREVTPCDLVPTKWNTLPSFPTKQANPSYHHDNLAYHVNCHATELIRIMCEGKIWFGRLQAYQLVSGLLNDTRRGVTVPSLPITIIITSDRQGCSLQHLLYWASTHYINQSNIKPIITEKAGCGKRTYKNVFFSKWKVASFSVCHRQEYVLYWWQSSNEHPNYKNVQKSNFPH
jgi:hypothetical protein